MIDNRDYGFRKIERDDLELLLKWRNSERIHKVMLTDHIITMEEHKNWFENISKYNPLRNFIFTYKNRPIGYFGYTQYDDKKLTCSPGSYIGEISKSIPADAGLILAYYIHQYGFATLKMKILVSDVLENNKRVLHLNKLLGYEIIDEYYITKNGKKVKSYKISISKEDWDKKKDSLLEFFR